jgi:hypothetical protein
MRNELIKCFENIKRFDLDYIIDTYDDIYKKALISQKYAHFPFHNFFLLPWFVRRRLLILAFGFEIHPTA